MKSKTILKRYRDNYNIPEEYDLTIDMVNRHWDLERKLTKELMASTKINRTQVFIDSYTRLYKELFWLNIYEDPMNSGDSRIIYDKWVKALGNREAKIYEIGSGSGKLIRHLASLGYNCTGTEITNERNSLKKDGSKNLVWHPTDGVNLTNHEEEASYDVVISSDVIEHLHPDDIEEHFRTGKQILRRGGKYIISTPHFFHGPSDVSAIFGKKKTYGMHLKEYRVYELVHFLKKAGYSEIYFPSVQLTKSTHKFTFNLIKDELNWICFVERILDLIPRSLRKKIIKKRFIFPLRSIFIVAVS